MASGVLLPERTCVPLVCPMRWSLLAAPLGERLRAESSLKPAVPSARLAARLSVVDSARHVEPQWANRRSTHLSGTSLIWRPADTAGASPCWLVSPILPVAPAFVASRSGGRLPPFRPAPGLRSGRSLLLRELPSIARCSD